jgi:glycosyltransferase involved in cell wall biosynthesis
MPRKAGMPVIGWFGGYYDPKNFVACEHFVGVTPDIVRHMTANGVPADRAHYIPTFPDVRNDLPVDKRALQTPPGAKVVLALSRLHPKKGLDTLLRAVATLSDVHVWLAGDGPLQSDLQAVAEELGMQDRAHFLGWRTDRAALLRAADVCALPSRYEPFGTVILEAWAAGTPLVACKSAGPAAHVVDGKNGLLVEIDDVDALSAALARVLTDPALRKSLIGEGFTAYLAGFTREAVTAQMVALYRKLGA